jgi:ferredoxin
MAAGDTSFEVELKSSGRVYVIPPDKTILQVLIEAGEDPLCDCQRGECGICQCGVIEGIPDHRDFILSQAERASNKVMQICVSRSKTARLVLDL